MPDTQSFIIMYILSGNYNIVCIGYHLSPSKTSPSLFCQASPPATFNLQTAQAPLFRYSLCSILVFCKHPPPHLKIGFFSEPKILNWNISQFEFFVMTGKNIFVCKLFFHQIFQVLGYFLCKNCTSPPHSKRSPSSFPSTLSKNLGVVSSPPLFEKLVGSSTHPPDRKGGGAGAHYVQGILKYSGK